MLLVYLREQWQTWFDAVRLQPSFLLSSPLLPLVTCVLKILEYWLHVSRLVYSIITTFEMRKPDDYIVQILVLSKNKSTKEMIGLMCLIIRAASNDYSDN